MIREYNSFADIEERLKVLKREREITQVSLKLNFYRTLDNLNPVRLLQISKLGIKKMVLKFMIKKLSNLFRR